MVLKIWKQSLMMALWATSIISHAELVLDGTLGPALELQGPSFNIEAHLGKQVGNNLFHSFEKFNLSNTEVATFLGPDSIENVISRVTGGEASYINGVIQSFMPKADMYFLNPAGILFGQNVRLNVPGAFYASTADYLRLGADGRFDATHPEQSLLKVATPSAFGFLDNSPATIAQQSGFLFVPPNKTLSFIGGNLTLQNAWMAVGNLDFNKGTWTPGGGKINLVSVASPGEVPVNPEKMADDAFEQYGQITIIDTTKGANNLSRFANIDASGAGGGNVYIRGGQIIMDNAYVWADTLAHQPGQGIVITASNEIKLTNGSRVTAQVKQSALAPAGNAGNITITTERMSITDGSQIDSTSQLGTAGAAGNITVSAFDSIEISGFSSISVNGNTLNYKSGIFNNTVGTGNGGQIKVSAPRLILKNNGVIRAGTEYLGDAGDISITVDTLTLTNGAQIKSSAGQENTPIEQTGQGGKLIINAKNILITGSNSQLSSNTFTNADGGAIEILASSLEIQDNGSLQAGTRGNGNAGRISLDIDTLHIQQGGFIATDTAEGQGHAGNIDVNARQAISITHQNSLAQASLLSASFGRGNGGQIHINTPKLTLNQQGIITSQSTNTGDAGTISINASDITLTNSQITTQSEQSGGGNILIDGNHQLNLSNSIMSAKAQGTEAQHNGGNLTIQHPQLFTLNNSELRADAQRGKGGDINLRTAQILALGQDNIIDASSQFGLNGRLLINDYDIGNELIGLPTEHFNAAEIFAQRCAHRREVSTFHVLNYHALPISPDDFRLHTLQAFEWNNLSGQLDTAYTNNSLLDQKLLLGCHYL